MLSKLVETRRAWLKNGNPPGDLTKATLQGEEPPWAALPLSVRSWQATLQAPRRVEYWSANGEWYRGHTAVPLEAWVVFAGRAGTTAAAARSAARAR